MAGYNALNVKEASVAEWFCEICDTWSSFPSVFNLKPVVTYSVEWSIWLGSLKCISKVTL